MHISVLIFYAPQCTYEKNDVRTTVMTHYECAYVGYSCRVWQIVLELTLNEPPFDFMRLVPLV